MSTILSEPEPKPSPGYSYILSAIAAFESAGLSFHVTFDYFFDHGWVIKEPDHFIMFCHDVKDPDAWLVYWAESHSGEPVLRTFLKHMPYYKSKIVWCRPFKGRKDPKYYSTDRLLAFIREAPPAR